eukprot:8883999-Pyramimonas_sp.AAC.1
MPPGTACGLMGPVGASCGILSRICAHEGHPNKQTDRDILNIWPTWGVQMNASLETSSKSALQTKD